MKRAVPALWFVVAAAASAGASGACGSKEEVSAGASPCAAFPKAAEPSLRLDAVGASVPPAARASGIVRIARARLGSGYLYAVDRDGGLGRIDAAGPAVAQVKAADVAIDRDASGVVRAFVARWSPAAAPDATPTFELVKLTSADGGLSFDRGTEKVLLTVPSTRDVEALTSLAFGPGGLLYVAIGDAAPVDAGAPAAPTRLGSILRLDVSGDAYVIPPDNPFATSADLAEVWATGIHAPRGLDVDPETGDVWLSDVTSDHTPVVHRLTRGSAEALVPALYVTAPDKRPVFNAGFVYRGTALPALVGRYVYPAANGKLVAVDRFGPSGPAQSSSYAMGGDGPLGRGEENELTVVTGSGLARVIDVAPPGGAPRSLMATRCWDALAPSGLPASAIPYDVTTPLWSDGAAKERFVVVPPRTTVTRRPDGDLVFPVGTVAVKTFVVSGKRVETRLLVQHDVEDWVGYSYAWNEAGTDAELVAGNRVAPLPGGTSWYFPSAADCTACHTPAAGYTLGLESRQLVGKGDALGRLAKDLTAPLEHGHHTPLVAVDAPAPATAEGRARSYLHANCASCHREGSATGTSAELDLRLDTPLAQTGLCREPQAGTLGIIDARVVVPGDPGRSVLVARMRALDERRMPRLGSSMVDEAGLAAVESWIRTLASCP